MTSRVHQTNKKISHKYPSALKCLQKDKFDLLAFYDFPAQQWVHIRTTKPIESAFSKVRLRTQKCK